MKNPALFREFQRYVNFLLNNRFLEREDIITYLSISKPTFDKVMFCDPTTLNMQLQVYSRIMRFNEDFKILDIIIENWNKKDLVILEEFKQFKKLVSKVKGEKPETCKIVINIFTECDEFVKELSELFARYKLKILIEKNE